MDTQKLVFTIFWSFLGENLKIFCSKFEKKSEKKNKKNYLFRNFYSGHLDRFLMNHAKGFCRKSETIQNFLKILKPQVVRVDTQKVVFTNFWSFLAKSLKIFCSKFEKILKRKTKKTISSAFFSGHLDRFLRTMPKVSAENPKRFKNFEKKIKATSCSCGHAEFSFHKFLKFFGQKSENILLKIRKNSEKKNKKKLFLPLFFTLDT